MATQTFEVDVGGRTYEVDAPDPNTAWQWANAAHKEAGAKREAAIKADAAAEKARFKQAEADRPLDERIMTNLGAGAHTLVEGARQLGSMVGLGSGVSDEELQESRQRKAELAEGTTGGGLIQMAGEVLPTLVVPGGAALRGATAIPKAGRVLKAAVGGPRTLRSAIGDAALAGAATGALQPVLTDESRTMNTLLGGAGGAAGAGVVGGAAKVLPLATKAGRQARTERAGGRVLTKTLGDDADAVAARLEARDPSRELVTGDIPLTAAEQAGDPRLARLEIAARREMPEDFAELARRQNEATYEAAQKAGVEGTDDFVKRASDVRDAITAPIREEALGLAGKFSHVGEPLQDYTAEILQRTAPKTPAHTVAKYVDDVLQTNPNPEQLYDLRKNLVRKLSGPHQIGDDISAAIKGAEKETMSLVRAIDERLNEASARASNSGDLWTKYLDRYTEISPQVTSARAQQQINEFLNAPGRPLVGNAPEVTRHVLKQALQKFGDNKFGTRLTDRAQSRYDELQQFLQRKEEPMRSLKLGGTGGPGSQTAMQSAARATTAAKLPLGGQVFDAISEAFGRQTREEVARLMLDPAASARAIRQSLAQGNPLTQSEKLFLQLQRGVGTGAVAGLTGQPATQ